MPVITKLSEVKGEPRKYRKKPVVVRAVQLQEKVEINTKEGVLVGQPGDFLIEGVFLEIYPCDEDIFNKTYEEVKD